MDVLEIAMLTENLMFVICLFSFFLFCKDLMQCSFTMFYHQKRLGFRHCTHVDIDWLQGFSGHGYRFGNYPSDYDYGDNGDHYIGD